MTEITVVIQGMVMLVASTVYQQPSNRPDTTGAAIAIEASTAHAGSFGVMIPAHLARVVVPAEAVTGTIPPLLAVSTNPRFREVALAGHRIQFGSFSGNTCTPLPGDGASGAIFAPLDSAGVPDLSLIMEKTTISERARPNGADYSKIDRKLVAGWLEITTGTLAVEKPSSLSYAEFRPSLPPSLYRYRPVPSVTWSFDVDAPCMLITPFGGSPQTVQLQPVSSISIDYQDAPDLAAMSSMIEAMRTRRGVSYDFELMYGILKDPPVIPPLPYVVHPDPASITVDQLREVIADDIAVSLKDAISGLNCGPGGNPHP